MVSADTLAKSIYTISIICALIFIIFVWKLPVFCVACEPNSGIWYRCISGGTGTKTCEIEEGVGAYNATGISKILKELLDYGIKELPKDILNIAVGLKNDLVKLGQSVINGIKETISNVTQKLTSIFNDYVKAPIITGYNWVKDEVVIPVIQGVVNYIINPIKSLIGSMIELKDAAINAIKTALVDAKNLSVKIYDYTYGNLIAGFDLVPEGLVDFVIIIQNVLNGLKNGIIGGANEGVNDIIGFVNSASNFLMHGLKSAIQGTEDVVNVLGNFADTLVYDIMSGAKTAVNAIVDGANWLIDQITWPFIYAINYALTFDFGKSIERDLNKLTSGISKVFAPVLAAISNPIINATNSFVGGFVSLWNKVVDFQFGFDAWPIHWHIRPFGWLGYLPWTNIKEVDQSTFQIPSISIPSYKLYPDANFKRLDHAIPNVDFDAIHICGNPNQCVSFAASANAALPGDNPIDAKNVIPNPPDLFWAGKRPVGLKSTILGQSSTGVCSLVCANNGYQSSSVVNGTCVCSRFSLQTNLHIGVESCVDVCNDIGGTAVCATCPNEVVLANDPSIVNYTLSSPSNTFTSNVQFPVQNYTTTSLLSQLAVLLANDININTYSLKTLTSWNISSSAFTFSYSGGVISLKFNASVSAVSKAMITISFSTNPILATVFGFTTTSGTKVTLQDAAFSTSTAATSTSAPNMVMQQYKGWMIYNYSSTYTYPNSSYYIYMNPKLFLLQSGSTTLPGGGNVNETNISQSQLSSYINMGTYYNDSTGNNHYALTSQYVGYQINTGTAPISLKSSPDDAGYKTSKLASGLTLYTLNYKNYFVYDDSSMLYPMSLTNFISFGATPALAGYTQQTTGFGMVYYVKNGQTYIYDNLAGGGSGSFFPVYLNQIYNVAKGTNLTKPTLDPSGIQLTNPVFTRTSLGQAYGNAVGNPYAPKSGVECYQYGGRTYVYDIASASSTTTQNNLYLIVLSQLPLVSTLAGIGLNASNKYAPLSNVYSNSSGSYYYYDRANTLYPLFGNAPLTVNVTSSSLAAYTYSNNNGFVYYIDGNGNNYAYDGLSTLYLLSSLSPYATIYGSPLVNGYTASSKFGYTLNGNTYAFFQVPSPLSLLKFLTTSDCSAACGNNEMIFTGNPSSLTYGFVSATYNVRSSITFPLFPRDIYGNLIPANSSVTFSYTPQTFLSTFIYLLCQDLNSQKPLSGEAFVFTPLYFDFSYNSSTNKYTFALQNSLLPTLGLGVYTFYTSLNIIMASNMGVSSTNDITISTTGANVMSTTAYPSSGTTSLTASNNILTYRLVDIVNIFDYTSSLTFPVNTYNPSSAIQYLLFLITQDINSNTNNAYNLGYTDISVTYSSSTGMYTFILPILPSVTITFYFKKNTAIGSLFGMGTTSACTDLVLFPCVNTTTFTSSQSLSMSIMNYKGWNLYSTNGGHYVYMDPKLFLLSGGSTTCATLSCNETIVSSLAPYTQVNTGSTQYYILPNYTNNTSTPYFLTTQLSGYAVNTKNIISLKDDKPLNLGYQLLTTNNGLNYYKDNVITYYVVSNVNTLIQVSTTPVSGVNLMNGGPDKLSYVFKQGTRTITGILDFPGRNYTSITFAEELVYMLSQDISSQGVNVTVSDLNITFDQTITKMNFSANSTIPFQLLLKFGGNTILSDNFGVTGDVLVVTTYPAQIGPQSAISVNPYTLAYTFADNNFHYNSYITFPLPFTYNTPAGIASTLANLLAADINSRTTYNYVPASFVFSYNATTRKFTMSINASLSFPNAKRFYEPTIVLQFTKDNKFPIQNSILPSTWGQAFGFISDTTITKTPVTSTLTSSVRSPMSLSYLCTDSANIVNITSAITFDDTLATDATLDTYITALTTLLSADIMSKQSAYQITPSSFAITYSGANQVLSFGFGPSVPLTLTLQFSLSPLIASNFGCSADITFASILPFVSPNAAIQNFTAYEGIEVYMIKGKQCAYISGLNNFYPFVAGDSKCSFGQCKESLPLTPSDFASYTNIGGALQKTGNTYIYNASYNTLYPISNLTTPTVTLYGPYSDNGYTQMSICNLDGNGNCTSVDPTAVPMAYVTGNKDNLYAFVTTQKTLVQFATNSVNVTQCPCQVQAKITPSCNQICSLQKSALSDTPLKCQNPNTNGGSNPAACQCYETGPVNVIIEPMQKYNPFRLIQSGVSAGFNELSKGIGYAVKNFLVPIWNTIRLVISFAASIIVMVLQFIVQYGNPVFWFEQIKTAILSSSGDNAIIAKAKEFINNTILPGLKSIWDYRIVIFNGIASVASKVWSSIMGVLSKISKGIASVVGSLFTYIWEGIKYGWNYVSWFVGTTVEVLTPFIPIPAFVKFTIIMLILILAVGAVIGIDELIIFVLELANFLYEEVLALFSRVYAVTQDIIFGSPSD
jgi:hypothetical protein